MSALSGPAMAGISLVITGSAARLVSDFGVAFAIREALAPKTPSTRLDVLAAWTRKWWRGTVLAGGAVLFVLTCLTGIFTFTGAPSIAEALRLSIRLLVIVGVLVPSALLVLYVALAPEKVAQRAFAIERDLQIRIEDLQPDDRDALEKAQADGLIWLIVSSGSVVPLAAVSDSTWAAELPLFAIAFGLYLGRRLHASRIARIEARTAKRYAREMTENPFC